MESISDRKRIDTATRVIKASAARIYRAFLDPEAWVKWLPPDGMKGRVLEFEPREGGSFRMALTYIGSDPSVRGKTTDDTDIVQGRFLKLNPDGGIVQAVTFESDEPAFAGEMRMTWRLLPAGDGTEVTVTCENVPEGIRPEDHDAGLRSTLENLSKFAEQR